MSRYPTGQPVRLSTTVRDLAGALVNATVLTLTIQKPDATQQSYSTPTNDGTGLYHQDIPAADLAQVGRYPYKWVATGTGAGVADSAFDMYDPFDPTVMSLTDAKAQLNITSTANDEELRFFMDATTRIIEGFVGPVGRRTYSETVYPVQYRFATRRRPLISVTSVVSQVPGGPTYDPTLLLIDGPTGVCRQASGIEFIGPLTVVYVAGRIEVSANIEHAGRIILQQLWTTQRGGAVRPGMGGGVGDRNVLEQQLAAQGFVIPPRAVELLSPDLQPGFA